MPGSAASISGGCGAEPPKRVASRSWAHGAGGCGARKRIATSGGCANGMQRKLRTPSASLPDSRPRLVSTTAVAIAVSSAVRRAPAPGSGGAGYHAALLAAGPTPCDPRLVAAPPPAPAADAIPPSFWIYLASRFCAAIAVMLMRTAIFWHVFEVTGGSNFHVGVVGVVQFAPTLLFTLVG